MAPGISQYSSRLNSHTNVQLWVKTFLKFCLQHAQNWIKHLFELKVTFTHICTLFALWRDPVNLNASLAERSSLHSTSTGNWLTVVLHQLSVHWFGVLINSMCGGRSSSCTFYTQISKLIHISYSKILATSTEDQFNKRSGSVEVVNLNILRIERILMCNLNSAQLPHIYI